MNLYYNYDGNIIKMINSNFVSIDNFSIKKMDNAIKTSITRKFKIRIEEYIKKEYEIDIKKCAFCDEYSDFKIVYEFKPYKKSYIVLIKDILYDKLYCMSKNKNCEGRNYNPNSIEFVSKVYSLSTEDALNKIHQRNKSPFYECNYKNKEEYRKYQSLKDRFSDNDKYNDYISNLKYSKTINYYIEKHGEIEGKKIWYEIQSKKDSMSFNYFLKKNKNDYKKTLIEYKERLKSVNVIRGANSGYSKESYNIFNCFLEKTKLDSSDIIFGENEYFITYYDDEMQKNRKYFYDFVDLRNKIIIEYNGINWHPNKEKMTENQYENWYHPFDKSIERSVLEKKDIHKKKIAEENNFKVITLWNTENKEYNLNVIINYYKNKNII